MRMDDQEDADIGECRGSASYESADQTPGLFGPRILLKVQCESDAQLMNVVIRNIASWSSSKDSSGCGIVEYIAWLATVVLGSFPEFDSRIGRHCLSGGVTVQGQDALLAEDTIGLVVNLLGDPQDRGKGDAAAMQVLQEQFRVHHRPQLWGKAHETELSFGICYHAGLCA